MLGQDQLRMLRIVEQLKQGENKESSYLVKNISAVVNIAEYLIHNRNQHYNIAFF